jgi:hypothetical protein
MSAARRSWANGPRAGPSGSMEEKRRKEAFAVVFLDITSWVLRRCGQNGGKYGT